jgi:carbonic anhydrase
MNMVRLAVIKGIAVLALFSTVSLASAVTSLTPNQAFSALVSGNYPFTQGNFSYLSKMSQKSYREAAAPGQSPYAVVLGCIDSRVPPEIIFDKGLNEIFSVRVAGNVVAPHEIGSIEYAVGHVGVPLIVVLGHSKCGAVTSTVGDIMANNITNCVLGPVTDRIVPPDLNSILNSLNAPVVATYNSAFCNSLNTPNISDANKAAWVEAASTKNINDVALSLLQSAEISALVAEGKVRIVKGKYDVFTGAVTWILP